MNSNTILAFRAGTGRNQLAVATADWSTATPIRMNSDTGTAITMNQAILAIPLQTARVGSFNPLSLNANPAILGPAYGRLFGAPRGSNAPYFNSSSFDGIPFRVRASGELSMGANGAQSIIVSLVHGPAATIGGGGNSTIATTGAALAAVAGGSVLFSVVADIQWSLTKATLLGTFVSQIAFAATQQFAPIAGGDSSLVPSLLAYPAAASVATLQFQLFLTAGNAAASTITSCEFALEAL